MRSSTMRTAELSSAKSQTSRLESARVYAFMRAAGANDALPADLIGHSAHTVLIPSCRRVEITNVARAPAIFEARSTLYKAKINPQKDRPIS